MADSSAALLQALFSGAGDTSGGGAALNSFNKTVAENDIFSSLAPAVMGAKFNRSTWTPTENLVTSAAQSFLGGILGEYGKQNRSEQLGKMASVLPSLYSDPMGVQNPGVDDEAFSNMKLSIMRDNALQGLKEKTAADDMRLKLFAEVFSKNPSVAVSTMPEAANKFGIKIPEEVETIKEERKTPGTKDIMSVLAGDAKSPSEKLIEYTEDFAKRMPPTQAGAAASKLLEGEMKANNRSFDEAKAAREYGQNLLDLSSTAKAGIGKAGETGSFPAIRSSLDYLGANIFGLEESAKRLEGDKIIGSLGPDIIKAGRSPGALSDRETQMLLQSGVSTSNKPETNMLLAQKMEDIGRLNMEYADFLETYREARSGNMTGADKKWAEYKRAFPLFKGEGENMQLNSDRPSWQEFFTGQGAAADMPATAVLERNMDTSSTAAKLELFRKYRLSGRSLPEAQAAWAAQGGK